MTQNTNPRPSELAIQARFKPGHGYDSKYFISKRLSVAPVFARNYWPIAFIFYHMYDRFKKYDRAHFSHYIRPYFEINYIRNIKFILNIIK